MLQNHKFSEIVTTEAYILRWTLYKRMGTGKYQFFLLLFNHYSPVHLTGEMIFRARNLVPSQ